MDKDNERGEKLNSEFQLRFQTDIEDVHFMDFSTHFTDKYGFIDDRLFRFEASA